MGADFERVPNAALARSLTSASLSGSRNLRYSAALDIILSTPRNILLSPQYQMIIMKTDRSSKPKVVAQVELLLTFVL